MSEALLKVDNLSVKYTGVRFVEALKRVSFDVKRGEILGIIGESGSGKTTLAYSILNLLPENADLEGKILFQGRNITSFEEKELCQLRGKKIGIIPQEPAASFNPVFTIGYQFDEFLKVKQICRGAEERNILMGNSLKKARIDDPARILRSYPYQLSGGQLQRAMIALSIAAKPDILIADEPTSSLDVTVESQLVHMFLSLKQSLNLTIVFITHNLGLIEVLCDRVVVLCKGVICEVGDKRQVLSDPKDEYTKTLLSSISAIEK